MAWKRGVKNNQEGVIQKGKTQFGCVELDAYACDPPIDRTYKGIFSPFFPVVIGVC